MSLNSQYTTINDKAFQSIGHPWEYKYNEGERGPNRDSGVRVTITSETACVMKFPHENSQPNWVHSSKPELII